MRALSNTEIRIALFSLLFALVGHKFAFAQNSQNTDRSRVVAANGKSAMECVKLISISKEDPNLAGGGRVLSNQCGTTVEITWCYSDGECERDSGAQWTIAAGKSWPVSAERPVRFAACYGANTVSFEKGSSGTRFICTAPIARTGEKTPQAPSSYRPSVSGEGGVSTTTPENGEIKSTIESRSNVNSGNATTNQATNSGSSMTASGGMARPLQFLPQYFSIGPGDYPPSALSANQEGVVHYRLTVEPNGKPSQCAIVSSSGHPELDQATCSLLLSRSRFRPALDGSGNKISGTFSGGFRWRIPEPEPPTQQGQ